MKDLQPDFDADILVIGGGTAGCAAAIKAKGYFTSRPSRA